eukprot:6210366-Pleurochrysis_carterae.AAC.1
MLIFRRSAPTIARGSAWRGSGAAVGARGAMGSSLPWDHCCELPVASAELVISDAAGIAAIVFLLWPSSSLTSLVDTDPSTSVGAGAASGTGVGYELFKGLDCGFDVAQPITFTLLLVSGQIWMTMPDCRAKERCFLPRQP